MMHSRFEGAAAGDIGGIELLRDTDNWRLCNSTNERAGQLKRNHSVHGKHEQQLKERGIRSHARRVYDKSRWLSSY